MSVSVLLICLGLVIRVSATSGEVAVKKGDWVKYNVVESNLPNVPQGSWDRFDFVDVTGIHISVNMTLHYPNGTDFNLQDDFDINDSDFVSLFESIVIPTNLGVGDECAAGTATGRMATIENETTRVYAGASRTVIGGTDHYGSTFYWDKQTGVMVESNYYQMLSLTAIETNMWSNGGLLGLDLWVWGAIIAAILAVIVGVGLGLRRRGSSKSRQLPRPETPPPPPP
jgi:hypothetical protein